MIETGFSRGTPHAMSMKIQLRSSGSAQLQLAAPRSLPL